MVPVEIKLSLTLSRSEMQELQNELDRKLAEDQQP
jgi:hypothetical protein